jgi:outer membrane protein OmpA-like peptidoglycan-associated protein
MKTSWTWCAGALAAAVGIGGCADQKHPGAPVTEKTFVMFPTNALVAYQSDGRPMMAARCVIDPRIAKACDIAEPRFDFDSASVPLDADLDKLAKCFTDGPMAGKTLYLVGRADARGAEAYNFELGRRRAQNVAAYLEDRGMPDLQVITASRGERDAVGVNERDMADDRRVDIFLVDEPPRDGQGEQKAN